MSASAATICPLAQYVRSELLPGERPYVVVDAARDRGLAFMARQKYGHGMISLFEEPGATRLEDVAPYMVGADVGSEYLNHWEQRLGSCAGIIVVSAIRVPELRAHLRRIFVVTDESEEEEYFFRFYDPRVLRVYLPTCTEQEAREFFGPIRRILVESEDRGLILTYGVGHTGLEITETPLAATGVTRQAGSVKP